MSIIILTVIINIALLHVCACRSTGRLAHPTTAQTADSYDGVGTALQITPSSRFFLPLLHQKGYVDMHFV